VSFYVVRAKARRGERLEFVAEAGPGDFIYVSPFVFNQHINASASESLECVVIRSDNEAVVVNLPIEPVEKLEKVSRTHPVGTLSPLMSDTGRDSGRLAHRECF
jgi:uncharacterized RmlC-like cupin family protein